MTLSGASAVFYQQDGGVTKRYYARLAALGPIGIIAMNLFRAQKRSSRAKDYRPGRFRRAAYDVKQWSLEELCRVLEEHGKALRIDYGWKSDPGVVFGERASFVLYVDLPGAGQVSFHSPARGCGPEYQGIWDGMRGASEQRILKFVDQVAFAAEDVNG